MSLIDGRYNFAVKFHPRNETTKSKINFSCFYVSNEEFDEEIIKRFNFLLLVFIEMVFIRSSISKVDPHEIWVISLIFCNFTFLMNTRDDPINCHAEPLTRYSFKSI